MINTYMKSIKNGLLNKTNFNPLRNTVDLSGAILDAEQNLKDNKLGAKTNTPVALCKAKNLLVHIESLLNETWLIPNENVSEHSRPAYANLKFQIKDIIKKIDETGGL